MKLITEYNDLKAIADSIREKTSTADEMRISEMPSLIRGIENGIALPQLNNPAAAADILINKQAIDENGQKVNGSMPIIELATPTITFNSAGTITAKVTQGTSGYLQAGTQTATDYLDTKEATTYGAKTTDQTIAAKQYLVGAQTIKKVEQSGLSAENIIKGKTVTIKSNGSNLWNITGTGTTITPSAMTVYRGSSYPTSPKENDIFVNAATGATYIYISNNWVSLTLKELSYVLLNGATVDNSVGFGQYVSTNGAYQTGTLNNSGIYLAGTSNLCKNLWTNSLIDFSKYDQLKVTYNVSASSGDARNFGVFANPSVSFSWQNGSTTATYSNYQWFAHNPATGTYTQTIDISGWTNKMYLGFISECSGSDTLTVTVTKIEFI